MTSDKESKIDENGVEYYAPDLGAAKPLKLPDREDEDEHFETRLDDKVIFQRVAKDLYKYPQSAVRELLVNAIGHGARKANNKYGADNKAYVEVKLHPYDRSLVITDVRGMGMTYAEIKSLMSFVGRSGNMDSETAGQFGMGYFSHLKISDSCIVTTKVREPYNYKDNMVTGMSFLNNKGWQWQKINNGDQDIDLEYPGTQISLTMNEDTNIRDVIKTIREVARYSDIVVQFILEDDYDRIPAGIVDLEQISDLSQIHPKTPDQEVIILDDEDVYFKAVMQKDRYGNMSHELQKVILLARVPIQVDTIMIPSFSGYVFNIKNERKFTPQPDRERLSAKSEIALKAKLEELFKSHFSQLKGTTAEEIEAMPLKYPVIFMRQLGIERFFTKATKDFISSLVDHTVKHITFDEAKITTDYGQNHNLLQVLAYRKDAIVAYNKALAPIVAVSKYCKENNLPSKHFIRIDKEKTSKIAINLLEEWKVPKLKEYMIENKIKAKSNSKHTNGIIVHSNKQYRQSKKETDFGEIDFAKTIWIKGAVKPWIKMLWQHNTDLCIAKYSKSAFQYAEENELNFITDATLYGQDDIKIITYDGIKNISKWYKGAKALLNTGYSNKNIHLYTATPTEIQDIKRVTKSLFYLSSVVTEKQSYGSKSPKKIRVDNAIVVPNTNECVIVHDIYGNKIKIPFENNFLFIMAVYELVQNGGSEVTDAINEQIKDGIILPSTTIKNYKDLYSQSVFYSDLIDAGIYENSATNLSDTEFWKIQDINIDNYFGIENKYSSLYGWRSNIPVMKVVMELLQENIKNEDTRQMIFKGIHNSDYETFCRAFNITSYIERGRTEQQLDEVKKKIQPFIVGIAKHIPEINSNNQFDVFLKTRHILNGLESITDNTGKFPWLSGLRYDNVRKTLESMQKTISNVNSKITIKGKFADFINEFLKNSKSNVVETDKSITVTCEPTYALGVKNMVELHSDTSLQQIMVSNGKIVMLFKLYEKGDDEQDEDDERINLHEIETKCQCGCNNKSVLKIAKHTSNKTEDDDNDDN